ncbi:MAG TPA: allantoinase AllB [Candidatus Bathyarchaeia archaeon]|nr:allantoinase AllB [Candidatus Bathyarchaeia archaeon]
MAQVDLTIKNGTIVTPTCLVQAGIAVKAGKIVAIASNVNLPDSSRAIDATGLYVLPGIIDVHVHLRDPGYTYKEDFKSGTSAAAAGGITCVFDMPNNYPPVRDVTALKDKIDVAEAKAIIDYGLYGLLTDGNLHEVKTLARAGIIGYKCFMGETLGKIGPPSDGEMLDEFAEVAAIDLRVSVHAENDPILQYRIEKLRKQGRGDAYAHYESRPHVVEEEAVNRAILYARETKCKLHVAHLSSIQGVDEVREAKQEGQPITVETEPHYLLLDSKDYAKIGSLMKVNPSVKTDVDRASLWNAINDGTIDMIASDHAPQTLEEKTKPVIFDCMSGFPGLETSVPLMLTQIKKGLVSLTRYVQLTSENPAKAWSVYPQKGCIAVDSDADFTIVDLKMKGKVEPAKFLSKSKWSPFENFEFEGSPVYTIVRGNVVMEHGNVDSKVKGKMIRPIPNSQNTWTRS